MNAVFLRIARRDTKSLPQGSMQRNREKHWMTKDRGHLKNVTDTKGTLHEKMGTIKERKYMDLTEAAILRSGGKNTQKS